MEQASCTRGELPRSSRSRPVLAAVRRVAIALALTLPVDAAASERDETYVFRCDDGNSYTVQAREFEARVFRAGGTLDLLVMVSDEGRRYSDGHFELRIEGQQALLGAVPGELLQCDNDRRAAVWEAAKLDGVDFRAVGSEPGWHLEFRELSRIVLVADYGTSRVEVPLPEPTENTGTGTTRWDAGELVIEVTNSPCADTMSGEKFPSRVIVHWQGRTLRGCGRPLH